MTDVAVASAADSSDSSGSEDEADDESLAGGHDDDDMDDEGAGSGGGSASGGRDRSHAGLSLKFSLDMVQVNGVDTAYLLPKADRIDSLKAALGFIGPLSAALRGNS